MAGITRAERERRATEAALVAMDRPFRDAQDVVAFVGRVQRAYCEPCKRRDWGAQIRIAEIQVFRCANCMAAISAQLIERAREAKQQGAIGDGSGQDEQDRQDTHPAEVEAPGGSPGQR